MHLYRTLVLAQATRLTLEKTCYPRNNGITGYCWQQDGWVLPTEGLEGSKGPRIDSSPPQSGLAPEHDETESHTSL